MPAKKNQKQENKPAVKKQEPAAIVPVVQKPGQIVVRDQKTLEMVNQLKLMISNGQRLTDTEAIALANFCVIEGLDPFNQEAHLLKSQDGKIAGCMVGIKGLRRKAMEQLHNIQPAALFTVQFKPITPPTPDIEIAVEATLRDTISIQQYSKLRGEVEDMFRQNKPNKMLDRADLDEVKQIVGEPPVWKGLGYFYKKERSPYKDAKFPPMERAQKRAESAAIRARFQINYRVADENGLVEIAKEDSNIIDGEFNTPAEASDPVVFDMSAIPQGAVEPTTPGQPQAANKPQRPFEKDHLAEIIAVKANNYREAKANVNDKDLPLVTELLMLACGGDSKVFEEVLDYLCGAKVMINVDDGNLLALKDWLAYTVDKDTGEFKVNELAIQEIGKIYMGGENG